MRDHKAAAAGDRDTEISAQNGTQSGYSGYPDNRLIEETLLYLQGKFLFTLSDIEDVAWKKDLSKVPVWKLARIDEFAGSRMGEIWKFFESLQLPPEKYRPALPEPKSTVAKDFFEHMRILGSVDDFTPTVRHCDDPEKYQRQRDEWVKGRRATEKASLEALHAKHPHAGFDRVIRARGI